MEWTGLNDLYLSGSDLITDVGLESVQGGHTLVFIDTDQIISKSIEI